MFLHPKKILDVVGTRALAVGAGVLEPAGTNGTTFVSWPEFGALPCEVNSLHWNCESFHSEVVTYKPTEYGKPVQGKLIIQTEELQISMQLWGLFQRSQSDSFVFGDGVCWAPALTGFGLK